MENKQQMKAVTVYVASVKFNARWYTSPQSKKLDDALNFIKRARLATHTVNMPCNIVERTAYEAAQ